MVPSLKGDGEVAARGERHVRVRRAAGMDHVRELPARAAVVAGVQAQVAAPRGVRGVGKPQPRPLLGRDHRGGAVGVAQAALAAAAREAPRARPRLAGVVRARKQPPPAQPRGAATERARGEEDAAIGQLGDGALGPADRQPASGAPRAPSVVGEERVALRRAGAVAAVGAACRQLPSSSASITDATSRSTSGGKRVISLGSRGWQIPWNRAASTSRAAGADSVCRTISWPACVRP